jgi:hypothetical protein
MFSELIAISFATIGDAFPTWTRNKPFGVWRPQATAAFEFPVNLVTAELPAHGGISSVRLTSIYRTMVAN